MKRVSGNVTWKAKFDNRFLDGIRSGKKRQTIRRGEYVEEGDTLILAGPTGEEIMEVEVKGAEPIQILIFRTTDDFGRLLKRVSVRLGANNPDIGELAALAEADGFACPHDIIAFMEVNDMFIGGIFDGQLIRW